MYCPGFPLYFPLLYPFLPELFCCYYFIAIFGFLGFLSGLMDPTVVITFFWESNFDENVPVLI